MRVAVIVALIAATPPTLGVLFAYTQSRVAMRNASEERTSATTRMLDGLGRAVDQLQETMAVRFDAVGAGLARVESRVDDVRDRVAKLEGAAMAHLGDQHLHD